MLISWWLYWAKRVFNKIKCFISHSMSLLNLHLRFLPFLTLYLNEICSQNTGPDFSPLLKVFDVYYTAWISEKCCHDFVGWWTSLVFSRHRFDQGNALFRRLHFFWNVCVVTSKWKFKIDTTDMAMVSTI